MSIFSAVHGSWRHVSVGNTRVSTRSHMANVACTTIHAAAELTCLGYAFKYTLPYLSLYSQKHRPIVKFIVYRYLVPASSRHYRYKPSIYSHHCLRGPSRLVSQLSNLSNHSTTARCPSPVQLRRKLRLLRHWS